MLVVGDFDLGALREQRRWPSDRYTNVPRPAAYRLGQGDSTAVCALLEQRGMARAELAPYLGGRSRVSEFFAGKRPLSITQIQQLRQLFHVPADLLLEKVPA